MIVFGGGGALFLERSEGGFQIVVGGCYGGVEGIEVGVFVGGGEVDGIGGCEIVLELVGSDQIVGRMGCLCEEG